MNRTRSKNTCHVWQFITDFFLSYSKNQKILHIRPTLKMLCWVEDPELIRASSVVLEKVEKTSFCHICFRAAQRWIFPNRCMLEKFSAEPNSAVSYNSENWIALILCTNSDSFKSSKFVNVVKQTMKSRNLITKIYLNIKKPTLFHFFRQKSQKNLKLLKYCTNEAN